MVAFTTFVIHLKNLSLESKKWW